MSRTGWARLCVLGLVTLGGACAPPAPDTVLLNGHVFTADPANPWAEALALRGDRVVAVGTTAEVAALASSASARRDLGGRAVIPGFNDAHVNDPGGDAAALTGVARAAIADGVTSMQWFVDGRPVAAVAQALLAADTPLRIRVFRMPRTGADGQSIDSRPHLPPQPSFLLDVRGMGFVLGAGDEARIHQAVGWGYGTEDLLAIEPRDDRALAIYVDAVTRTGTTEVWMKKRPRLEHPGMAAVAMARSMTSTGMVVVQRPEGTVPMSSLVKDGVTLALGSGVPSVRSTCWPGPPRPSEATRRSRWSRPSARSRAGRPRRNSPIARRATSPSGRSPIWRCSPSIRSVRRARICSAPAAS